MKVKNNTEAPQLKINWKHLFLVALHVIVVLLTTFSHDFTTTEETSRALPQASSEESASNHPHA
jgi:hypothetical protein